MLLRRRTDTSAPVSGSARGRGLAVAVFAAAFVIRWATLTDMRGDDHWPLWTAATVLNGDRPFRDFADLGNPLYWGVSALAQWVSDYRVIGEVALASTLTAGAFTVAFLLASRATGSLVVGAGLALLASLVTAEAELYGYTKLFIYPFALWLCWRYIDRPNVSRSIVLALGVAVAFGYRHDHGAYTGAAAAAAVLAAHWSAGPRQVGLGWLRFGSALALLLLPFFVLVQRDEGILSYFDERMRMAAAMEASSRRPVPFTVDPSAAADWIRVLPAPPARVFVTWDASVGSTARNVLERKYSLTAGVSHSPTSWEYALTDTRSSNVRALVQDPDVDDTGLIDRDQFRPAEESWVIRAYRAVPLFRLSVAPRYWHPANAGVTLHYVSKALPYVLGALLLAGWAVGYRAQFMPNATAKVLVAAVLGGVAFEALIRRMGYFMDHTAVATMLGSCLVAYAVAARRDRAPWLVRVPAVTMAGLFMLLWVCGSVTYAQSTTSLKAMNDNWLGLWWRRSVEHVQAYSVSPPIDGYAPRDAPGGRQLIRYVYECTRPEDRVWVMTDMFHFPYYTERRIVRHIYWDQGFLSSPAQQRRTIAMVERDSVPIIISNSAIDPMEHFTRYPLVHDYVARWYTSRHVIQAAQPGQGNFYVLADARRTPSGTDNTFGFPCFR